MEFTPESLAKALDVSVEDLESLPGKIYEALAVANSALETCRIVVDNFDPYGSLELERARDLAIKYLDECRNFGL